MVQKLTKVNPVNAERITPDLSSESIHNRSAIETGVSGLEMADSAISTVGSGANLLHLLNGSATAAGVTGVAAKFEPLLALLQGIDLARVAGSPQYRQDSIQAVNNMDQSPGEAPGWLKHIPGAQALAQGVKGNFNPAAAFQAMGRAPATIYGLAGQMGETASKGTMNQAQQEAYDMENYQRALRKNLTRERKDVPSANLRDLKPGEQQAAQKYFK
jgi:hypothetical protein